MSSSCDFTYTWTPPFQKKQKFGKLLQFVASGSEIYAMMLNESGRIEQVLPHFLRAIAPPTAPKTNNGEILTITGEAAD